MGVVFLAEQTSLRRLVALKIIRPEALYFPGARERFQREVETVAKLDHPGIVKVHAVGTHDGLPYFAMELVRGCTLAEPLAAAAAVGHLEQALRLDPGRMRSHTLLAFALASLGRDEEALVHLRQARARGEEHLAIADVLIQLGHTAEARAEIDALRQSAQTPQVWAAVAELEKGLGAFARARDAYERALELDPAYLRVHLAAARLEIETRHPRRAAHMLREAAARFGDEPDVHEYLSVALWNAGDREAAVEAARRAVALAPESAAHHRRLANDLRAQGDVAGLRAELERWARRNVDDADAWHALDPTWTATAVALSLGADPAVRDTLARALEANGGR